MLYDLGHKSESLNLFWLKEKMFPRGFGTLQQTCKWPCKLNTTKGGGSKKVSMFGSVLWNKLAIKSFQLHFMLSITSSTGYTGYSETQWKKWSSHFSFWSSCSSAVENACFWNGAQQLSFQFSFEASNTCVKMVFALPATKKAVITVSCYELFHLWP